MTTALATATTTAVAVLDNLDADRVALLRRTLCPDLSNDEMELFAGVCRRTGLDPFAKQIYAMKRRAKKPGTKNEYEDKLTIQTGIDGFRVIACRTSQLDGQDGPYWCGPDGVWLDVWLKDAPPAAAKVIVFRRGCSRGFTGIARFSEYAQFYDGKPSGLWGKMSAGMIAKCAEALALRKAFPADLSGLYTSEEMDQAGEGDATEAKPIEAKAAPVVKQPAHPLTAAQDRAKAIEAKFDRPGDPVAGRDPVHDTTAMLSLCYTKGWDWASMVRSINEKFSASHGVTQAWEKYPENQRTAAVAALRKLPDQDTREELAWLLDRVAHIEKAKPEAVFQRFQAAAKLPESCIRPEHLEDSQVLAACKAFRAKLAALVAAK